MPVSTFNGSPRTRIFVETWAPAGLGVANSAITAMIYRTGEGNEYLADIRRAGELTETVTAPTLDAIRSELRARATSL